MNEPKKDADILNSTSPKYETYNYSGFTKEEVYAFHMHMYDDGDFYKGAHGGQGLYGYTTVRRSTYQYCFNLKRMFQYGLVALYEV